MTAAVSEDRVRAIVREELRQEFAHDRAESLERNPRPAFQSLDAVLENDDAADERLDEVARFFELTRAAFPPRGLGEQLTTGLHRGRQLVEHGAHAGAAIFGRDHHRLPTLHGRLTRYVARAVPSALRQLQRRAWVRHLPGFSSRGSGAAGAGVDA